MTPEQRQSWVRFRDVRFHVASGVAAGAFHPDTRVYGEREAQDLARQAFEAGMRATGSGRGE